MQLKTVEVMVLSCKRCNWKKRAKRFISKTVPWKIMKNFEKSGFNKIALWNVITVITVGF
jgi:hypothetical protein